MRKTHLAVLLMVLGAGTVAEAGPFSQTYFLGDSLTDSGQFMGQRFTTNPGKVWSQQLAEELGTAADPSGKKGTNYAVGGARVGVNSSTTVGGVTVPIPSVRTQLQQLRAVEGNRLDGDALYTVWGGANDLFAVAAGAPAQTTITSAIIEHVTVVSALSQAGARYILVPNIPDLGMTPAFSGNAAAGTQLSTAYNQALYGQLADMKANVIPLDVASLLHEAAANPSQFGLKNVTTPACGAVSSLQCGLGDLVEANADQTYLFADGVHPTAAGHKVLADYATAVLTAPQQVVVLAPAANQAGIAQMQHIDRRLHNTAHIQDERFALWGQGTAVLGSGDALGTELDGTGSAWMLGADKRMGNWTAGAYLAFDNLDGKLAKGSGYEEQRWAGGLYGRWQHQNLWLNGQVYYANLDVDSHRRVQLGAAERIHHGSADGDQYGGKISAGMNWQQGKITHGPVLSLSAQKATVKSLREQGKLSTAMSFDEQEHTSIQSGLGYQAQWAVNDAWQVYGSAQWQHEFKDVDDVVGARLNSVDDMHFVLPVNTGDAKNSGVLELGVNGNISEHWQVGAGVLAEVGDAPNAQTSVFVNTSYRF